MKETTITAQKGLCLQLGVGADEEVGHYPVPIALAANRQAVLPPHLPSQGSRLLPQGLVDYPQCGESAAESGFLREVGTHLTSYDVASNEDACVVGLAKSFSGCCTKLRIACQDVQED